MPNPRLELALKLVGPEDWRAFEKFASEFLAVEYPALRTKASSSGDLGRDAELYEIDSEPTTVFQYSVRVDWKKKINETVSRLAKTLPNITRIVYVTNQSIGANADDLQHLLRTEKSIWLDIRDRGWFVERENTYPQRSIASGELAIAFVDPLLSQNRLIAGSASLTGEDGRIAVLHLALEDRDDNTDGSLTKSCFNSLVLAALRGTNSDNRMPVSEIQKQVSAMVH